MNEYEKQAMDFLKETGTEFNCRFVGEVNGFPFDKNDYLNHFKYRITLKRNDKKYSFNFYGSNNDYQNNVKTVSPYDVLSCLQKYDVGTESDFILDFGITISDYEDAKRIHRQYKAVKKEYENVKNLFSDCMDEFQEIC